MIQVYRGVRDVVLPCELCEVPNKWKLVAWQELMAVFGEVFVCVRCEDVVERIQHLEEEV